MRGVCVSPQVVVVATVQVQNDHLDNVKKVSKCNQQSSVSKNVHQGHSNAIGK